MSADATMSGMNGITSFDDASTAESPLSSSPWSTKTDDFFPYSDNAHSFWTGYFTSRSSLKRLERVGSSFLHAARQIEAFLSREGGGGDILSKYKGHNGQQHTSPLRLLDEGVAIAQHHDG
eukprot:12303151-Ditylum_brightwellii.AAC.1